MPNKDSKIEWLGIDGFLIALYPIVVATIWFSIKYQVDFIIGKVVPYGTILVVCGILVKYFSEVMKFSKDASKK